jgi:uncharacterized membrane-anchored protein YjiN (DUF445 family)
MSNTPETDAELMAIKSVCKNEYMLDTMAEFARKLERERDEAMKTLTDIHRWIERNHPDGVIDSLTYSQNLERVTDNWYDRLERVERERDGARKLADEFHQDQTRLILELKTK